MGNKKYLYGMRLRPFGIACQPKEGFVERRDDPTNSFWDLLVYDRELTNKEVDDYDLKYLGEQLRMAYKFGSARYGWYAGKDKDGNIKWTSKKDCAMPVKDTKERDEIHAMLFEKGIMHDVEYEFIPWVDDVR